jgi:putative FmdB family regulatory protein
MPTYEYRCPDGHEFEHFVLKISAAKGELPCPTCGAVAPRKVSAGAGLLFKGSGFYITDYGKDGKKDQRAAAKAKDGATATKETGGAAADSSAAASGAGDRASPAKSSDAGTKAAAGPGAAGGTSSSSSSGSSSKPSSGPAE